jgi:hypothetical protein
MKKFLDIAAMGFFVVIGLVIIFVQAGTTGTSGGKQSSDILNASGSALSNVATALEGRG